MVAKRNRRYCPDLLENERGRFLSVIQPGDGDRRIQLAIPAQGLMEVRNALTEILAEVSEEGVTSSKEDQLQNASDDQLPYDGGQRTVL